MSFKNTILFGFFIIALLVPSMAQAVTVKAMRAGIHADQKTRIVFDLSSNASYKVFTTGNPARSLIVELPKGTVNAKLDANFKKSGLSAFKTTQQPNGQMRLVFALQNPLSIENSFTMAPKGREPAKLVIDLAAAHDAYVPQKSSGVLGQLVMKAPSNNRAVAVLAPKSQVQAQQETQAEPEFIEAAQPEVIAPPPPRKSGGKKIVVLDPGHGGKDTGAIGKKNLEKHITLAMAKELKKQLEATGRYTVKLTRSSDVFITLPGRVKFARENKANLFISLHADSIDHSNDRRELINGASIYTLSEKASDAQTAKLAERENKVDLLAGVNLGGESKEVADILLDLAMRETMNQSKYFANTIVQRFYTNGVSLLEKPHRFAGFAVLKAPDVPSVLIELGFMSNPREEGLLATDAHRRKIANAIKGGVENYFDKLESAERN